MSLVLRMEEGGKLNDKLGVSTMEVLERSILMNLKYVSSFPSIDGTKLPYNLVMKYKYVFSRFFFFFFLWPFVAFDVK